MQYSFGIVGNTQIQFFFLRDSERDTNKSDGETEMFDTRSDWDRITDDKENIEIDETRRDANQSNTHTHTHTCKENV